MKIIKTLIGAISVLGASVPAVAAVTLGTFSFENSQFGNSVVASDGGTAASTTWLNTVNTNPGLVGALTGANFNTGIANIGFGGGTVVYTIGYGGGIMNGAGADLGIVTARYSSDPITIAFSTDGMTFGASQVLPATLGVSTGVGRDYYFGTFNAAYAATLYVTSVDLSSFSIANGASIVAARVTGTTELDLIRVAGFSQNNAVPEPTSWIMMIAGFGMIGGALRRQRATVRLALAR